MTAPALMSLVTRFAHFLLTGSTHFMRLAHDAGVLAVLGTVVDKGVVLTGSALVAGYGLLTLDAAVVLVVAVLVLVVVIDVDVEILRGVVEPVLLDKLVPPLRFSNLFLELSPVAGPLAEEGLRVLVEALCGAVPASCALADVVRLAFLRDCVECLFEVMLSFVDPLLLDLGPVVVENLCFGDLLPASGFYHSYPHGDMISFFHRHLVLLLLRLAPLQCGGFLLRSVVGQLVGYEVVLINLVLAPLLGCVDVELDLTATKWMRFS